MAIGRTFKEALHKAIRSLEIGHQGFEPPDIGATAASEIEEHLRHKLRTPNAERLWYIADALRRGMALDTVAHLTY